MERINIKKRGLNKRLVSIIFIVVMLIAICGQVYADVNGYDNMFFVVKDMQIASANSKDEIFNDNEILLSYKYLQITEDVKMQINKIEIVDDNSVFYLNIKNSKENNEILPFHYIVRVDKKTEDGYVPVFRPEAGGEIYKGKEAKNGEYQDLIKVPHKIEDDEIITLEILNKDDSFIRNAEINIETQEITVTGEKEAIEKISQIEFNKYLSAYALLNDKTSQMDKMSRYMYIGAQLQSLVPEIKDDGNKTDREFENELAKSITTENLDMKKVNNKEVLNVNEKWFAYDEENDAYIANFENGKMGQCLKINNISYKDGIYTVEYIYLLKTTEDIQKDRVEDLPQEVMTLKLRINENTKYAKYQMVVENEEKVPAEDKKAEGKTEEVVTKEKVNENNNVENAQEQAEKTVELENNNGEVSVQKENTDKVGFVKTGDNVWVLVGIIVVAVAGLAMVVKFKNKKK